MSIDRHFMDFESIPQDLRGRLYGYVHFGLPPGGFLSGIISNQDVETGEVREAVLTWLARYAPPACYGSEEAYLEWMKAKSVPHYQQETQE